ncbi:hypothetical protein [Streptomyces sp. NBC_00690]|uniref:hypothetical protein n=1 Tax=Streptomyces sp. NBC_00690 TaxID=2975808 RepID=UPI002E287AC9|nr:hypothetical protein [Streptomyces sp. NBC_00690]
MNREGRRRTKAEIAASKERVVKERAIVVARYRGGESRRALAREYEVYEHWLSRRFDEWQVPQRGRAQAMELWGRQQAEKGAAARRAAQRRTREECDASRKRVIKAKETVIRRYRDGEPRRALADAYRVHLDWLDRRFAEWGVPFRSKAEAASIKRPMP